MERGGSSEDFIEVFKKAVIALEKLENQERGTYYFETFIRYIVNSRQDITITDVYEMVKEISFERSEDIMTIAEQLIREGMERGIEKGIEKTARNLLRLGFLEEEHIFIRDINIHSPLRAL